MSMYDFIAIFACISQIFGTAKGMNSEMGFQPHFQQNPSSFLRKLELVNGAKVLIPIENVIVFLKIFSQINSSLNSDDFGTQCVDIQILQINKEINEIIETNQLRIGSNLCTILYNLLMSCKEIGYELDGNSRLNAPSALEHKNGSTLCFIGMFTAMAELMCKEIHKIDELVKHGLVSTAFIHRITVAQFDAFGIGKNNFDVRQCAASVEQMFNFWSKSKDKMTADRIENPNVISNDAIKIIYPIQNAHLKQQLLGLTHQNLCNFVAKKIMMDNPSEEGQNEMDIADMEMDD